MYYDDSPTLAQTIFAVKEKSVYHSWMIYLSLTLILTLILSPLYMNMLIGLLVAVHPFRQSRSAHD
jgi:hypothetical protein